MCLVIANFRLSALLGAKLMSVILRRLTPWCFVVMLFGIEDLLERFNAFQLTLWWDWNANLGLSNSPACNHNNKPSQNKGVLCLLQGCCSDKSWLSESVHLMIYYRLFLLTQYCDNDIKFEL